MIDNFTKIEVESPVDKIIYQIRDLIVSGKLKPGEKLPSERQLSDIFGVGRTYIRDAIKKLEFFGILKALPHNGTLVSGADISVLKGLFKNVIQISGKDFFHLVETRVALEKESVRLAAIRRTEQDIEDLWHAYHSFEYEVKNNNAGLNEDFLFHLKIAESSQNPVIKSLMLIIIPDILSIYKDLNVCGNGRYFKSLQEHAEIIKCIEDQNIDGSMKAIDVHLHDVYEFSKSNRLII